MEENNQIAIIQNSIETFRSAPEVLRKNQDRTAKAVTIGNRLIDEWHEAWAIENEDERFAALAKLDERSNTYLVKCGTALTEEKAARAAITQLMDNFKRYFTEAEYELDKAKPGTTSNKVQSHRDAYVKEKFILEERRRKEEEVRLAQRVEEANIRSRLSTLLNTVYLNALVTKKEVYMNGFNAITLENYEEKAAKLMAAKPAPPSLAMPALVGANLQYHTEEQVLPIAKEILEEASAELIANWNAELTKLLDDLRDKLPSKKAELDEQKRIADEVEKRRLEEVERQRIAEEKRQKEIAEAKSAAAKKAAEEAAAKARQQEAARLAAMEKEAAEKRAAAEREQKEREEADKRRLEAEAAEAAKRAEEKVEMKKAEGEMLASFEKESALADTGDGPSTRVGKEIVILHPMGWLNIFQLWFEREGKNLPVDKIGATKMDSMKTWCEKQAVKTGERLESKFLRYEDSVKAIAKKK